MFFVNLHRWRCFPTKRISIYHSVIHIYWAVQTGWRQICANSTRTTFWMEVLIWFFQLCRSTVKCDKCIGWQLCAFIVWIMNIWIESQIECDIRYTIKTKHIINIQSHNWNHSSFAPNAWKKKIPNFPKCAWGQTLCKI